MTRIEWESLCNRCGKCCYSMVVDDNGIRSRGTIVHCTKYDSDKKECLVYSNRFAYVQTCIELFPLMLPSLVEGFLPEDCGYMMAMKEGKI